MNRETFAHYGWIIIVASVMAALLVTATPIGVFIGDAAINIFAGYKDTSDNILDKDHISDKEDEWEDMLFDGETFTATFITGGGTWEDGTTGNKTVDYDIKTELLAPAKVSKAGSTFLGWQVTTAGGNWTAELFNNPNQKKLFGAAGKHGNVVFTARWDSDGYTATFYPNNGIWDSKVTTALTSAYTSDDVLKAPTGISRLGYTFSGWKVTTADGNWTDGKIYKGAASTDVAGSDGYHGTVCFTAVWTPNTYSIEYVLAGGTSGGSQPTTATYDVAFNVSNPKRAGYAFAGWNIKGMSDDCTHYYGDQTTTTTELTGIRATTFKNLRATSGTVVFTAVWNAETYSIQYNLNQGSSPNAPSFGLNHPETALVGEGFTVNHPTMEGYNFVGWDITGMDSVTHYYGTSSSSNTTTKVTSLEKTTATWFKDLRGEGGIVKFTARWEPKQYDVTYGGNHYNSVTVASKGTFNQNLPFSWTPKTRTGYHYVLNSVKIYSGNNTSGVLLATYTSNTSATYKMTPKYYSSIFIFVDYAEVPNTYTIAYDYGKGTGTTTPKPGANVPGKGTYDSLVTISNPTREGYVFKGWDITGMDSVTHYYGSNTTTSNSLTGIKDTTFKNLRANSGTVTFKATWTPITYSIAYNLAGGTSGGTQPTTATFDVVFNVSKPSKTAYKFAGWTISGMDSTTHYYGSKTSTATTLNNIQDTQFKNLRCTNGTVTFTANWTAATYNAVFEANNGTWADGSKTNKTVNYTIEKILSAPDTITREGYTFSGWKLTSQTGGNWTTNKVYNNATQTTLEGKSNFYGDLVFVAQWTPKTYSITYGGTYGTASGPSTGTFDRGTNISWVAENATGYHYVLKTVKVYSGNNTSGTVLATYTSGSSASFTMSGKYYTSVYVHVTYEKIPNTYTIAYNLNRGGSSNAPAYGTYHPTQGTYDTSFTVSHPTMLGYKFSGWTITGMDSVTHYYGSNTTTATSLNGIKDTTFKNLRATAGTVTFTANWTPITYSIQYNLNRGNATTVPAHGSSHPTTATYDSAFTVSTPSMKGYYFAGWTISGMDSTTHYYGSSTTTDVTIYDVRDTTFKNLRSTSGTVLFTAKWVANGSKYHPLGSSNKIEYDLNKGSSPSEPKHGANHPTTYIYDTGFTVSHPTMSGYVFTGWTITGLDTDISHYYGDSPFTIVSNAVSPASNPSTSATIALTKATYFINLKKSGTIKFTANWKEIISELDSQSFVYNGNAQQPSWVTNPPTGIDITGQTSGTYVDTYVATLIPSAGYCWSDGSTASKTVKWYITQRPITITGNSSSKVYDGTALTNNSSKLTSGTLGGGDTATYTASGSITNVGTANNVPNVVIKKGTVDVTSNYKITKINGTLTVTKKNITVKASDANKVYDGTALTKTSGGSVTSGSLVSGHTITTTNSGSITNVGTATNKLVSVVIKSGSTDVTSNYNITFANGTLTVTKRAITVTAGSSEKVYDGTPLTNGTHTLTGTLASGQSITVKNSGTITNVGSTSNPVSSVVIKNSAGTDVTSNYAIKTVAGTLRITNKSLTIKAGEGTKVYDGSALTNKNGYTIVSGGVSSGHTITVTNTGTITNVGSATNKITTIVIKDASGKDVTTNYTIVKQDGTLKVTQRPITITGNSASKVYDGTALTSNGSKLTSGTIVSGQTATYTASGTITNVGSVSNVPNVVIKSGSTDVTSNYAITKVNGTLTITNATMSVTGNNYSGTYDGNAHTGSVTVSKPTSGYTIKYGTSSGTYNLTSAPTYTNAGTYTVYYQVTASNYTAKTGSFTVTISKKPITITGNSASKVYDGKALTSNGSKLTNGSLVSGQTATYTASGSITNVGTANNVPNVVIKSGSTDVTSNYAITKVNGTLTVTKATMSVSKSNYSGTYDAAGHTGSVTVSNPTSGYTIKYGTTNGNYTTTTAPRYTNVGTYTVYYQVTHSNYNTVTGSFTVTINKKPITVTASSANKVYDGTPLTSTTGGSVTSGSLLNGHQMVVTNTGSRTAVGTSNNTVSTVVIKDGAGNNVTSNYNITYATGTLKITARPITITAGSTSMIYSGSALTYNNAWLSSGTLASGHKGTYTASGSITSVGTGRNVPSAKIVDANGNDVTSNYSITKVNGTLTITDGKMTVSSSGWSGTYDGNAHTGTVTVSKPTSGYTIKYGTSSGNYTTTTKPSYTNAGTYTVYYQVTATGYNPTTGSFTVTINKRPITITAGTTSKYYDGTALTYNNAWLSGGSLVSGHTAVYTASGSQTSVGSSNNVPNVVIKSGSTNVTSNYSITKVNGTLTVNTNTMTVSSSGWSGTYDGASHTGSVSVSGPSSYTIKYGTSSGSYTTTSKPSYVNAGTYTVYYQVTATGYTTKTGSFTVTINKRAITITAGSKSKEYNGTALTYNSATITSGSLASSDSATLGASGSQTNVGSSANTPTITFTSGSANNYTITKVNGTLTVTQPPHSHNYSSVTYQAGCTQAGYTLYTCSNSDGRCDNPSYTVSGAAAAGHWDSSSNADGSCGSHHTPDRCNDVDADSEDGTNAGHTSSGEWSCINKHNGCSCGYYEHEGRTHAYCARQTAFKDNSTCSQLTSGGNWFCGRNPWSWCYEHWGYSLATYEFNCSSQVTASSISISHGCSAGFECNPYKVTFNANGGSVSPSSKSAYHGGVPSAPTPTKTASTFKGWYTSASGGTKLGEGGDNLATSGSTTVYAQWTCTHPSSRIIREESTASYHWYYCDYCLAITDFKAHVYNVSAATCTTAKVCTVCDYTAAASLGHNPVNGGTSAVHKKCSRCGVTTSGSSGHSYSNSITKAATCTATGVRTYTCGCGYSYTTSIAKNSSNHSGSSVYGGTSSVHTKYSCCGATISSSHSYSVSTGVQYSAATCTTNKRVYYKCACGYDPRTVGAAKYVSNTALGHNFTSGKRKYIFRYESGGYSYHYKYNTCTRCGTYNSNSLVSTDYCYTNWACTNKVNKSGEKCYYCGHTY